MKKATVAAIALSCIVLLFNNLASAQTASANDDGLKMNQIQVVASHNSYHMYPDKAILRFLKMLFAFKLLPKELNPKEIEYSHEHLMEQLEKYHLHGLELDIWNDPQGGHFYRRQAKAYVWKRRASRIAALKQPGFKILHIADIDFNSTNNTFVDALQEVKQWSDAHPDHLPLFINVEVKVEAVGDVKHIKGFVKAVPFDSTAAEALDAEVKSVFGNNLDGVITPDRVRGSYPTLEKAVLAGNWPTLGQARGKVVFIIDAEGYSGKVYETGHPSLQGRVMFVYASPGTPQAAFVMLDQPLGTEAQIRDCVQKGYIVRTQCDEGTIQARQGDYTRVDSAINSGCQILSTDYYHADPRAPKHGFTNYHVSLPNGKTARVDPIAVPDKVGVEIGE